MQDMKNKETILEEGFSDIIYSQKTVWKVLEEVYEYGFANGFKQGNDNAREVAEFERKKEKWRDGRSDRKDTKINYGKET